MKRLICIILGLNLFSIVFAETNLFAEMPAPYYNFGKSYVSDFEHNLLCVNDENRNSRLFYLTNTELRKTLSEEKTDKPNRKKGLFYASLSPAVLPGISLGYGWINYDEKTNSYNEVIPSLHINSIGFATATGISLLTNCFINSDRKGFFFRTNIGVDYVVAVAIFGGKNEEYLFPNLSIGGGYSFKIGKNSFLRISLDVGLKWLVSNLNLSIII